MSPKQRKLWGSLTEQSVPDDQDSSVVLVDAVKVPPCGDTRVELSTQTKASPNDLTCCRCSSESSREALKTCVSVCELTVVDSVMLRGVEDPLQRSQVSDHLEKTKGYRLLQSVSDCVIQSLYHMYDVLDIFAQSWMNLWGAWTCLPDCFKTYSYHIHNIFIFLRTLNSKHPAEFNTESCWMLQTSDSSATSVS